MYVIIPGNDLVPYTRAFLEYWRVFFTPLESAILNAPHCTYISTERVFLTTFVKHVYAPPKRGKRYSHRTTVWHLLLIYNSMR